VEDPSKPNGTIIEQMQTGYEIDGRVLREAMVIVTKDSAN
jgi:molecular chaperone GrpE (heat shock protein)